MTTIEELEKSLLSFEEAMTSTNSLIETLQKNLEGLRAEYSTIKSAVELLKTPTLPSMESLFPDDELTAYEEAYHRLETCDSDLETAVEEFNERLSDASNAWDEVQGYEEGYNERVEEFNEAVSGIKSRLTLFLNAKEFGWLSTDEGKRFLEFSARFERIDESSIDEPDAVNYLDCSIEADLAIVNDFDISAPWGEEVTNNG